MYLCAIISYNNETNNRHNKTKPKTYVIYLEGWQNKSIS